MAEEAQHDRPIRRVALAGEGERAVQGNPYPESSSGGRFLPVALRKQLEKSAGRRHRPHRVGRGRTDADLEYVENAQKHLTRYPRFGISIFPSVSYRLAGL